MEVLEGLWWHIRQFAGAVAFFWPISLLFFLLLIPSFIVGAWWRNRSFLVATGRLLLLLAALVIAYLIFSLALGREPARYPGAPIGPGAYVVSVAFLIHTVAGLTVILRSTDRLRLVPVFLATLWVSLCCWFIAFLSTSGAASL